MSAAGSVPSYDIDLFTDDALAEPYGHDRVLRDRGPVVRLEPHGVHVVARFEDVRAVLADPEKFCSGQGVGLNDALNAIGRGTTVMSDGDGPRRWNRAGKAGGHRSGDGLPRRVERSELAGTPVRKLNNVIRAFDSLPMRVVSSITAAR